MGGTSPMKLCVRSSLIFSAPGFNHNLGFLQGQKPVFGQALPPKLAVKTLNKCTLDRLPRLDEMQRDPMLIGPRVQGVPCELRSIVQHQNLLHGPSSKDSIENSADPLLANRAIISITSTSFEYGSVIVKHLNRRPLASRSWTKSIAYQSPGRVDIGSTMRERMWISSAPGGATRALPLDRSAQPSGDSPFSLPVAAARISENSRSIAWSRRSLVSLP